MLLVLQIALGIVLALVILACIPFLYSKFPYLLSPIKRVFREHKKLILRLFLSFFLLAVLITAIISPATQFYALKIISLFLGGLIVFFLLKHKENRELKIEKYWKEKEAYWDKFEGK